MPYINEMLFKTNTLSEVLIVYVFQIVPLSIILTFTAILQGYGKLKKPALFLIIGFLLKIILNVRLIGWLGVLGAAVANDIGLLVTAFLLIVYLKGLTGIQFASGDFYKKVGVASLSMAAVVLVWLQIASAFLSHLMSSRLMAVVAGLTAVFFGAFAMLTIIAKKRVLVEKEWYLLPFGRRMAVYQLWLNSKK